MENSRSYTSTRTYTPTGEATIAHLMTSFEKTIKKDDISPSQYAQAVWMKVNGDRERKHTRGIYLKESKQGTVLIVYLDSSSLVQDFTINKHLYIDRLRMSDLEVCDIKFSLSRYSTSDQHSTGDSIRNETQEVKEKEIPYESLPPLTQQDIYEIQEHVETVPPELRNVVYEALISMKRRSYASDTDK